MLHIYLFQFLMHAFSSFILRFAYCHIDTIFIVKMLPCICSKTSKWFSHWLLLYNIFLSSFASYSFNAHIQGLGVETRHVWSDNHMSPMRKMLRTHSGQRYIAHTNLLSQRIAFKKVDMPTQLNIVENEDYDNMTTDQTPKCSRTTGMVSMNTHIYPIIIR